MNEEALTAAEIRSRIKEVKTVCFGDVQPHPRNPKIHPQFQREAFRGAVRELGFVSVPIAYHSERNGGALTWADGHLRGSEVADYTGEVAILDIDDKEADYLLVTADPIAALAQADAAALDSLLREVNSDSRAVDDLLAELALGAEQSTLREPGESEGRDIGKGEKYVKAVIAVSHVETFERAIAATGETNRERAILAICEHYLAAYEER